MDKKKKTLFKNTLMLYILQGSAMVLSFLTFAIETHRLAPSVYGLVTLALAIMGYFQLFIDYGFLLSATEDVSKNREDTPYLCRLLTSVSICKLIITLASFGVLLVLCRLVPSWRPMTLLLVLFLISTAFTSFMPDYMYRGIERMTAVTIRTVLIRVFFTFMIFLTLKGPEDIYFIPIFNIIGNGLAMAAAYIDLGKRFKIRLCRVRAKEVWHACKRSSVFFVSRFATSFYLYLNTLLLGIIYPSVLNPETGVLETSLQVGLYGVANQLITTGKNVMSPIADSLYPYMTVNKDFKLVKKILMVLMPIIIAFCTVCFIWAEFVCALPSGAEYAAAGNILRAMLPVGIIVLPSYLCGYPMLTAMGLNKHANYSVIFGSLIHITNLVIFYFTGLLTPVTLGILLSVTEAFVLVYRLLVIYKHRDRLNAAPKEEAK